MAVPTGAPAYDDVAGAVERAAALANSGSRPPFTIQVTRVPLGARPASSASFAQAVTRLLAGGEPPDAVLVVNRANDVTLPAGEVADLVGQGFLAPLDDLAKSDKAYQVGAFYPAALDALRHQGAAYARPLTVEPLVLYSDPELFMAAGVRAPDASWDWSMLRESARRLTREAPGGQPGQVEQWGLYSYPPLWYLLPLIWQNGGDVVAPDGHTVTLAEPEAVAALEYFHDLVAVRRLAPPPAASGGSSPWDLRFQGGRILAGPARVAMAIGPGAPNLRQVLLDYGLPDVQLGLALAELPQGKLRATGLRVVSALAVTTKAPDKPAAYAALSLLERGAAPHLPLTARKTTADQLRQVEPSLSAAHAAALAGALANARVLRLDNMLAASRVAGTLWQGAIDGTFSGKQPPAVAALAATRSLEAALKG